MIDRFGNLAYVSYSETECLWIAAANSLPRTERWNALIEIADMAGRQFSAVYDKAARMRVQEAQERATQARAVLDAHRLPRRVMVPESPLGRPGRRIGVVG